MPSLGFAAFEDRLAAGVAPPAPALRLTRAGDVPLAYEVHAAAGPVADVLIFYHGGGANMRVGYDRLAAALVAQAPAGAPLAVCLTDMRGHGASGGARGHSARKELVWTDVGRIIGEVRRLHPGARLHLGGHSSAAGLLLNAHAHGVFGGARGPEIASLVLLAPHLGYHAALDQADAPFDGARFWPFVVNWFSGGRLAGAVPAVSLDFTRSRHARALGCVSRYTVNMALAVTPDDPGGQLARLRLPVWVGIPDADEVTDPVKLDAFLARHAPAALRHRFAGGSHLGVILDAAPAIAAGLRTLGVLPS